MNTICAYPFIYDSVSESRLVVSAGIALALECHLWSTRSALFRSGRKTLLAVAKSGGLSTAPASEPQTPWPLTWEKQNPAAEQTAQPLLLVDD